jgi:hypothetical protein
MERKETAGDDGRDVNALRRKVADVEARKAAGHIRRQRHCGARARGGVDLTFSEPARLRPGRATNHGEAEWPDTLTGRPKPVDDLRRSPSRRVA